MASSPPGSSILPEGWTWSDIGHGALDIAGLVPIIGEGADLANAAWLAAEGDYLGAGLSIISMVPIVGDAIGKSGKLLKSGAGKLAGSALDALKKMDFNKMLAPLAKHPTIGPHVEKIAEALEKWRADIVGRGPGCTPGGVQTCSLRNPPSVIGKFEPMGYKDSPLKTQTGREMVASLERSGLERDDAIATAQQLLESGRDVPSVLKAAKGEKLYKLSKDGASAHTPYWLTEAQYMKIKDLPPDRVMSVLGLPPSSYPGAGRQFIVETIEAKADATVFQSVIAPVRQGTYAGSGGAVQTLVTERGSFGPPTPIGK
jgi:hypothetical protein